MFSVITFASILLACSVAFSEQAPVELKYFSGRVSDVEYDLSNDSYVLRRNPDAKQFSYVYTSGVGAHRNEEPIKLQPGETYVLARGMEAHFTQHHGVGCTLTFTNGISELNGVLLPAGFSDSERQLLIQGNYAVGYHVYKKYAFVVNAEGDGYDLATRSKFHFGLPFHAPKEPPKIDPGVEKIQRDFLLAGVETYKKAVNESNVIRMESYVKEGVTNAVPFVWEMGGAGNLREEDRNYLIKRDPEAARLFAMLDASRRQDCCVAFCTKDEERERIVSVARVLEGKEWRFWTYFRDGVPEFVFLGDGQGASDNYYEYGEDGLFRNFCLVSKFQVNFHTVKDGVLQKSSDTHKAQEFVAKVAAIMNRYVELDTTGTLKPFVEKLKAQVEEAKARQEAK